MLTPPRAKQRAAHDMFQQAQPQRVVVFARSAHNISFHAGFHIAHRRGEAQTSSGWLTLQTTGAKSRGRNERGLFGVRVHLP